MILQVSDDYRISSNSAEWQVEKLSKGKKGKKTWAVIGHYMDFAGAINGLTNYRIRTIEGSVVAQIKAAIFKIEQESVKTCLDFARPTL